MFIIPGEGFGQGMDPKTVKKLEKFLNKFYEAEKAKTKKTKPKVWTTGEMFGILTFGSVFLGPMWLYFMAWSITNMSHTLQKMILSAPNIIPHP